MLPDFLFNFFDFGIPWIILGIIFACFDFLFNMIMCQFTGGFLEIRKYYRSIKHKSRSMFLSKTFWANSKNRFLAGGGELTKEFLSDKLSWSWPITILAIPTAFFGITRQTVEKAILSLQAIGINIQNYSFIPSLSSIQYVLWGIAFLLSMSTFYRYQIQRSKSIWFSKIWFYNLSRIILFNTPLTYMILSTILAWLQFSTSIFQILSDNNISYTVLHPDLMYGLNTIYKTILGMGILLTILSFLPTLMLIREKQEKYSKIYYLLIYSGIIALFILLGILVLKFDQRLSTIQELALTKVQSSIDINTINTSYEKTILDLQYFFIVSGLPGHFPIPSWLNILLSARSLAFIFEIQRIVSPETAKTTFAKLLQKMMGLEE